MIRWIRLDEYNVALSNLCFFRFFSCYPVPFSVPILDRRRDRVKKRGQAIPFNDSQFSLKRPPFRLAPTFLPARKETSLSLLSRSRVRSRRNYTGAIPSHQRRSLEGTSAHTKPQLPLDPRPATSLLTVREMFILPFYRPLQRIFGFRPWPQSESQPPSPLAASLLKKFPRFPRPTFLSILDRDEEYRGK